MQRSHENPLFSQLLLLSALIVGSTVTLFVPPYREMDAVRDDEQPAAASTMSERATQGMTGIDVNLQQLELTRSTT